MRILIVRHAPAGNSEEWVASGKSDAARPLTPAGRVKMLQAVAGLAGLADRPNLIATSPYRRCVQTAIILRSRFRGARLVKVDALKPAGDQDKALEWLGSLRGEAAVALVGHEPSLGRLACRLLSGGNAAFIRLKKGACLMIEAPAPVVAGNAVLHWHLQPRQLRALGGE
ncbi:MAG: histidine phosphatase family protein [Elusimicrobiota bacterium]